MPFHTCDLEFIHEIIPRTEWAMRNAIENDLIKLQTPVKLGVIGHHTGRLEHQSSTKGTQRNLNAYFPIFLAESKLLLNQILQYNIENMKYSDIPYNYIIDSNGSIFEGRGLYQGAHTYGFNDVSIGVAVLGNYQSQFKKSRMIR